MDRAETLDLAKKYVTKDRQADHGKPEDTFGLIADLWNDYLALTVGAMRAIQPHDVAVMMALLKIARIRENPNNADNWVDMAGYAACGAELSHLLKDVPHEVPTQLLNSADVFSGVE